ncbi:hypothetical protein E3N88_22675 [Mikania micrantha]|uniref:Disease resistance protein Roq1-like winged-helix domain-containing protein n=1 Tax=Mikania micrantha TaxID=192012 RepID=A0A5N6NBC2_9ASTR|nr:hypothetical protein E3N88_22675 [Mikania micrantha]
MTTTSSVTQPPKLLRPETSFLKEIVDTIYNELDRKEVCLPLNIVGIAIHDEEINPWLEQCNLEFLVIYGMGGSGKTTPAKTIYHSNLKKFESVSFLEDIGRICEGSNGLLLLQEQLLNDISWGKWRKIPVVSRGTPLIQDALKMNKALVVLDDIVECKQLVALLEICISNIGEVKMLFLHIACFFVGKDMNYVVEIMEPDYSATLGIQTLINRCLVSVSPNKKLTMHRLLQEMGKNIVCQESDLPANRSRVWLSGDSYKIVRKRMGSETVEGLALDMEILSKEDVTFKDLQSLHILNLKDSHSLTEIRNISKIPHLETLILWNCFSLVNVCNTLGDLKDLALLNMTGCNSLTPTFPLPFSLHRLFLIDCHLECTDSFPLSFSVQLKLEYLNLANSLFESFPCYNHLDNLQVLDLSFCSRLKCLICLPSTLAELYIYGCEFLERITFQFSQFTLQEFGYLGCTRLYEVEGLFKLVPIAKLDETDLGHMKWLKKYQYHEVCLVGDDELTVDRSWHIQVRCFSLKYIINMPFAN